ncbi:MAG: NAD-dependent epimerase/dehydratase family protein, partial [Bacillota bacterium]
MIAITGATGHLGNNLVRALAGQGRDVRCLVLQRDSLRPLEGLDVEVVHGDVRDRDALARAFRGADVVFHLASVIAITSGQARLLDAVNARGTRNVVETCLECGVRRLVYTSSVHALVEPPRGRAIDEDMPFDPDRIRFAYGKSKARGTLAVLDGVRRGLDAVILSPTGIIGPYDFAPSEMGRLFIAYARGQVRAYVDGGYDFVDVRDVALGHIAASEKGRSGHAYVLSGERVTVKALLETLAGLTGIPAPRRRIPGWAADAIAPLSALFGRLARTKPLFTPDSLYYLRSNSESNH